ncbi:uncharacterized protein TNCV_3239971 [Trichonephila clavipes]|nr:uncharacterized protein TNCV_3239971 [Trichonephila clavipes]
MQEGAPPHITRCVTDVLKHNFTEERVISRQFRHLWPPRSSDPNPCDFWLWGHLKQLSHLPYQLSFPSPLFLRRHAIRVAGAATPQRSRERNEDGFLKTERRSLRSSHSSDLGRYQRKGVAGTAAPGRQSYEDLRALFRF